MFNHLSSPPGMNHLLKTEGASGAMSWPTHAAAAAVAAAQQHHVMQHPHAMHNSIMTHEQAVAAG